MASLLILWRTRYSMPTGASIRRRGPLRRGRERAMASEAQPLTLRAAIGEAGSTRPLLDGTVPTGSLRLEYAKVESMIGAYRRMVREVAYDVCELPIVTYLLARSVGRPFTALRIF